MSVDQHTQDSIRLSSEKGNDMFETLDSLKKTIMIVGLIVAVNFESQYPSFNSREISPVYWQLLRNGQSSSKLNLKLASSNR